jgi:iron complex transport system substrate-binding protein
MTVGGPQIISDAITLCGGENVFGHLGKMAPTVSVEAVLEADPEAIVAHAGMAEGLGQMDPDDGRQAQ